VYCRKSTNEGLDSDFSSLDNQREACEAFIASQRSEGWVLVKERFEDGGFSGGNIERPALQRLLTEIQAGEIDCVVVYKIDRLSRSLLDFTRLLELFEEKGVSFVSITQQLNTSTSTGRLMLNVLISFAQFEREIISERTSDKMCAARRKGKWMGGPPILGYDRDPASKRILVNATEAEMVREIFDLYLRYQSTLKVVAELNRRGWRTKSWTMKDGTRREGTRWDKARLIRHLTYVTYTGRVLHKGEIYEGEHEGIVDQATFDRVQAMIESNSKACNPAIRNKHGALLVGLFRCAKCGAAMAHTYTNKKGKLYRYYACNTRQKQGWEACDTGGLAAADVEAFVIKQIRQIGQDPQLLDQVFAEAQRQQAECVPRLQAEYNELLRQRQEAAKKVKRLVALIANADEPRASFNEELTASEERATALDQRLADLKLEIAVAESQTIDADHLRETLSQFDPLWDVLHPTERVQLVHQVVEAVRYNADDDTLSVTLRGNATEERIDWPF